MLITKDVKYIHKIYYNCIMIHIFIEWCIYNLNNLKNIEYLNNYRIYKKLKCCDKSLNYNIKLKPNNIEIIKHLIRKKGYLLSALSPDTIIYPYSYCPNNQLHRVAKINIRGNIIVYQCNVCNSVIVPKR